MKRSIILILLVILSCNMYGQQFTQGVFANVTLATHHKNGTNNPCYDEEIWSPYPVDVPTGVNLYFRIDSIAGPCDSLRVYRFPDYMYVSIPEHDTINLSVYQMNSVFLYYACNATVYVSLVAIGTPQILNESYDCNFSSYDQLIIDDNCINLITWFGASATCSVSNSTFVMENVSGHQADIYPNPAFDNITIESPPQAMIEITNMQGQLVKTLAATGNKTSIDISGFAGGVYVVRVAAADIYAVKKIIKE
jgi:hypothetical protein